MTLSKRINEDMKAAMKAKDKFKLSVLRMMLSEFKNEEIKKKDALDDDEIIGILNRELKKRRDASEEYRKFNREDTVKDLEKEINILLSYMPEQLTEEEIKRIVQEAINQTGAQTKKDMGRVMAVIMPEIKGKADGRVVNQIVQSYLE